MRDYSKPFFDAPELAAAFNGLCKCLGKDECSCGATISDLGHHLSSLASTFGDTIAPTGDLGSIGVSLETFIVHLITKGLITREQLRSFVDKELKQLPTHPFINYFEE